MAAPAGNQNAARAKVWRDAINRALDHWPDKAPAVESRRGLHDAAYEFVKQMMETKDLGFFREFGDRIDGKPAQAVVGDADADPIQVATRVEIVSL